MSSGTAMYLSIILILIPLILANEYSIYPYHNTSGIYFNHLGSAQLSNSYYTLLSSFNLTSLNLQYSQLRTFLDNSYSLCTHQATDSTYNHVMFFCRNSLANSKLSLEKLQNKINSLHHLTSTVERTKRGLFNGASYLFNWFFGLPDADDAKYYDNSIRSLLSDNKQIQLLMKQQISVITSTISNFNSSIRNLKINEEKFNNNVQLFNKYINQTTSTIQQITLEQIITERLLFLNQLLTDISEYCDNLISVLILAKHNY